MKNKLIALFVFLVCLAALSALPAKAADRLTGTVVGIADGDTLTLLDDNRHQHKIRLAEIDAPEKAQPFGQVSKKALSDLCFQKNASVLVVDIDRYGRSVGRVNCAGVDANLRQVEQGMAWAYAKYLRDPCISEAGMYAKINRIGLWGDIVTPTAPWDWRRNQRNKD